MLNSVKVRGSNGAFTLSTVNFRLDGLLKLKDFPAEIGGSGEIFPNSAQARHFAAIPRMLVGLRVASYLLFRSDSYE